MGDITNAELLVHLEYIKRGTDQTNAHLALINGRVSRAESAIDVLRDRSDESKIAGRNNGAIWGGAAGAFAGAAIWVWQSFVK